MITEAERAARAQAYREFLGWATREIADCVIRFGFSELSGVIERILHVYRQDKAKWGDS